MNRRQDLKAIFVIVVFYLFLQQVLGITCPILFLTGISCAGCGMSRALFCALRLDFVGAFHYHPLFWTVPIAFVLFFIWHRIPDRVKKILLITAICLYLCTYLIRLLDPNDSIVVFRPQSGFFYSLISSIFTNS